MKNLSNEELIGKTKIDIQSERNANLKVLHDIKEIFERRLHLERGYPSLYKFVMVEFGFSESETYTRIQAMHLLRTMPEVQEKLESGTLTLSNAAKVQSFIRKEKIDDKITIIKDAENKTSSDLERYFKTISPDYKIKDSQKTLNAQETRLSFTAGQEFLKKLEDFKNKNAHQLKSQNLEEIFALALEKAGKEDGPSSKHCDKEYSSSTRYVPKAMKEEILNLYEYQCAYQDPISGKRCGSEYKLELDHITPLALGGKTEFKNLRPLCKNHNLFMAKKIGIRSNLR